MRLFGVGTDIIRVKRLKKSLKKKLFLSRIYSEKEVIKCKRTKNSLNCFAKRYAAKEAFAKALGTGIAKGLKFNEIIIQNEKNGKPFIKLIDATKKSVDMLQAVGIPDPEDRINEYPSTSIIVNACNEILVDHFLQKKIPFLSIIKFKMFEFRCHKAELFGILAAYFKLKSFYRID